MIPFSKISTGQEEIDAVSRVIQSGWLAAGPETEAFEKEFAEYTNNKYAIFTNCCTSALKMSYKLLKEQGFDGISYPSNTFCATYSAASEIGLDILPDLCQNVGVKETQCQELKLFVNGVKQSIGTGRLISLNSAQKGALMNGKWAKECRWIPSLSMGISPIDHSLEYEQAILMSNGIILPILGYTDIGVQLPNAKFVGLLLNTTQNIKDILLGLTKTLNTQETEETGNSYVGSAISNMIIAKVNVHFGGQTDSTPCLIEDSAHRIEPNDPLVGKIRCYSFYATKNMTTGSGGMLVTNDKEIYERARLYWRDGLSTSTHERQTKGYDYEVKCMAGGYDGNDMAAAIGRVQLRKLPEFTRRRNEIVKRYNEAFGKDWQGNHLYAYGQDKGLIDYLKEKGIRAGYFYPPQGNVCLPLYPLLTDEEVKEIIKRVLEWKLMTGVS